MSHARGREREKSQLGRAPARLADTLGSRLEPRRARRPGAQSAEWGREGGARSPSSPGRTPVLWAGRTRGQHPGQLTPQPQSWRRIQLPGRLGREPSRLVGGEGVPLCLPRAFCTLCPAQCQLPCCALTSPLGRRDLRAPQTCPSLPPSPRKARTWGDQAPSPRPEQPWVLHHPPGRETAVQRAHFSGKSGLCWSRNAGVPRAPQRHPRPEAPQLYRSALRPSWRGAAVSLPPPREKPGAQRPRRRPSQGRSEPS